MEKPDHESGRGPAWDLVGQQMTPEDAIGRASEAFQGMVESGVSLPWIGTDIGLLRFEKYQRVVEHLVYNFVTQRWERRVDWLSQDTWDLSGRARTDANGVYVWRYSDFVRGGARFLKGPLAAFVATAESNAPVTMTTTTDYRPGSDASAELEVTVKSWDLEGSPRASCPFSWFSRVPLDEVFE